MRTAIPFLVVLLAACGKTHPIDTDITDTVTDTNGTTTDTTGTTDTDTATTTTTDTTQITDTDTTTTDTTITTTDTDTTTDTNVDVDADGDGYAAADDCDDTNADVHPGAVETCNNVDDNCDGNIDEGALITYYIDDDNDTYGTTSTSPYATTQGCQSPGNGWVTTGGDCNDANVAINPGATEVCDDADVDENCNGVADNADSGATGTTAFYADTDHDTYGSATQVQACDAGTGFVLVAGDCDDTNAAINPAAVEVCDALNVDENCNGTADDLDSGATGQTSHFPDGDGDGYGSGTAVMSCDGVGVATGDDCDDTNADINPGAIEICDGIDNDCDTLVDDLDPNVVATTWYADIDSDGYGDPLDPVVACDQPTDAVSDNTDCDDLDDSVNPGELEVCDPLDVDEDCNGFADDADPGVIGQTLSYPDADGDGFGDANGSLTLSCDGSGNSADDCDDTDPNVYPGAVEVCDGKQDDCDAVAWTTDDGVITYWDPSGSPFDLTSQYDAAGTTFNLRGDGTVDFCPGDYNLVWAVDPAYTTGTWAITASQGGATLDAALVPGPVINQGGGDLTVQDITLTDGTGFDNGTNIVGGGIYAHDGATLTVDGATVDYNTADIGAGIYAGAGTSLTVTNATVWRNDADQTFGYGGGIEAEGALDATITDSLIDSNTAGYGAGVETDGGPLSIATSTVSYNTAQGDGGGVAAYGADVTIDGSLVEHNAASGSGGGVGVFTGSGGAATSEISATEISSNDATDGGGLFLVDATVNLTQGTLLKQNFADAGGGAYAYTNYSTATLGLDGALVQDNSTSSDGAGLYIDTSELTVDNASDISGNDAQGDGGGFKVYEGSATVSGLSTVETNIASGAGGGIADASNSVLFVTAASVNENHSTDDAGGIFVDGSAVHLDNAVVEGNIALGAGGILAQNTSTVDLTDSQIWNSDGDGVHLVESAFTCTKTAGLGLPAGVFENTGDNGGLFFNDFASTVSSDGCDWGNTGTASDNNPFDLYSGVAYYYYNSGTSYGYYGAGYHYEDGATFTCTAGYCI